MCLAVATHVKRHAACIPAIRDHNFITVLSEHDFDTLDDVINAISLFWTSFFSFLRLEFHFLDPKTARKKNSYVRTDGRMAGCTESGLIWRLREPLLGTLKGFL